MKYLFKYTFFLVFITYLVVFQIVIFSILQVVQVIWELEIEPEPWEEWTKPEKKWSHTTSPGDKNPLETFKRYWRGEFHC